MPDATCQQARVMFKNILEAYISPLIHGVCITGPHSGGRRPKSCVAFDTLHKLKVYVTAEGTDHFMLKRRHPFSLDERAFLEDIVRNLHSHGIRPFTPYHLVISGAVEQAIARRVGGEHAEVIYRLMQVYNQWAAETYEGKRITHTTGIYLNRSGEGGCGFFSLLGDDCLKNLGSTPDTLLALDRDGMVLGIENTTAKLNNYKKNQDILAPIAEADIAMWTFSRHKAALRLTPSGEILIFKDKKLLFAKRRSRWRAFPHSLLMEKIIPKNMPPEEAASRKAVYLTALDIAMAHRGACLGVFPSSRRKEEGLKRIRPEYLFSSPSPSGSTRLLSTIVNDRKFFEIPRRIRADLCAIDGALIIDDKGDVLTAGAIVRTNGNSEGGGGRTAAAQTLGKTGFGIKISNDGYIEIYNGNNPPVTFA